MDGMTGRKQVFVIAATNRPDMIDPAMLRPGRLDKALYVDLPNNRERFDILKTLTRKTPLSSDVDLVSIANHDFCEGMSGADLSALVRQAATNAVKLRYYSQTPSCSIIPLNVCHENIIDAFAKVKPSVSAKQQKKYELLKVKFGTSG
jgi:ribosome biogenesis ATPase